MSAVASRITGVSIFAQPFVQAQIKENIEVPRHMAFVEGNPLVTARFPSPVTRRMFSFDDVIMSL